MYVYRFCVYRTIVVVGAQLLLLHTSLRLTFASANRDHDGGYGSRAPRRAQSSSTRNPLARSGAPLLSLLPLPLRLPFRPYHGREFVFILQQCRILRKKTIFAHSLDLALTVVCRAG